MQKIEIKITPDGKATITPKGFKGTECQEATKGLEKVLGAQVISSEPTRESRESTTTRNDRTEVA